MNYMYDISLNLNREQLYEFYEWREEDQIEYILKIPMFKVDEETFYDLKYNNIIISKDFLNKVIDKTEVYTPSSINLIRYCALFCSDERTIAIEFDSDGNSFMKSNVSIDDEIEIMEASHSIKYSIVDYKIKSKNKIVEKFFTRTELENKEYAYKKIKSFYDLKEFMKLKYIFYELYNEKLDDEPKIYSKLINIINMNDSKLEKLSDILNLMDNKKIMSNNS